MRELSRRAEDERLRLAHRRVELRVQVVNAAENQEADDLTNLEFKSFDMNRRLDVRLEDLEFGVLQDLFDVGDDYIKELELIKAQKAAGPKEGKRRKIADESLRGRDPW